MSRPPLLPDLSLRCMEDEWMDDPNCDLARLHRTFGQFAMINAVLTRVRFLLRKHVLPVMALEPERTYHLVDIGAGPCDVPVWLLKVCRARGLRLRVTACDNDARAVAFARERYGHMEGLTIVPRDAMHLDAPGRVDFVFANHLLHHLPDERIVSLLQSLPQTGARVILLSDIARCRGAYVAYYLLTWLLFRRGYAFEDGLLSIRKGFRARELQGYLRACGREGRGYRIERVFPARLVLVWKRGGANP